MDADQPRPTHVEREASHHVDGIRTTDADRDHPEPTGVRGVAVGADHHPAGERVVLEHDLMDDPRARLPESDPVARRDGAKEVIDLVVHGDRHLEVDARALFGLDQVIAVHRRGRRDLVEPRGHELQQRHLRGGVLHGDSIRTEVGVGVSALDLLVLRITEMVDEDLLRESEWPAESTPAEGSPVGERGVDALHELDRRLCSHSHGWPPFLTGIRM